MLANIYDHLKTIRLLLYKRKRKLWGGDTLENELKANLDVFLTMDELKNRLLVSRITYDIALSYVRFGALPKEYFLFDYRNSNNSRRKDFLTNKEKDLALMELVDFDYYKKTLRDKYKFYELFRPFFNRDVCKIIDNSDFNSYEVFVKKHPICFMKPIDSMCGIGAQILTVPEDSVREGFNKLLLKQSKGGWILEELIHQSFEFSQWNESSINTVRIPSFLHENTLRILKPFFRVGRKGMVVDNAACGGVFAVIDAEQGVLLTDGNDEHGVKYPLHPDSGLKFKGWQILRWTELLDLTRKAHSLLPNHPYIGWDFTLTDRGWVLIEGDWGQFISEFADQEGIKSKFKTLLKNG